MILKGITGRIIDQLIKTNLLIIVKECVDVFGNRNSLTEVTAYLQERLHRWQQIELLCGFAIMNNVGLPNLTATLYPEPKWMVLSRSTMSSYQMPVGIEDMEDDMPSMMPQKLSGEYGHHLSTD